MLRQYGIPVHRLSWALYRGRAVAFALDSVRQSSVLILPGNESFSRHFPRYSGGARAVD